jgi:hypothetical protein
MIEVHSKVAGLLGRERGRRHAGLSVDDQQNQNLLNAVITEVSSGKASET